MTNWQHWDDDNDDDDGGGGDDGGDDDDDGGGGGGDGGDDDDDDDDGDGTEAFRQDRKSQSQSDSAKQKKQLAMTQAIRIKKGSHTPTHLPSCRDCFCAPWP